MRFAVHRPGNPVASPRSHGVSRRDISSRVHVSIAGEIAGSAPEDGLALARLRIHLPTRRAALTRVMRLNFLYSAWSFLLEAAYQQTPSRPEDFTVEPGLLSYIPAGIVRCASRRPSHVFDHEGFDPDQVVPTGDVCADLFSPILAPVRFASAQLGDGTLHPLTVSRALLGAGELALQATQALALFCGKACYLQQLARRQRGGYRYTAVDSDNFVIAGRWDGNRNGRESNMPASGSIQGHPVRLRPRHHARPAEPHPSHLRNPNYSGFPAEPTYMLGLKCDNSESFVPPGLAPGRSACRVSRVDECGHRMVEVPQGLLLNHLRTCSQPWIFRPCLGELSALLQVARSIRPARVPVQVLLHREIPHIPGMRAVILQQSLLFKRRNQAIFGHTNTLTTSTDNSKEVKRRLLTAAKPGSTRREHL